MCDNLSVYKRENRRKKAFCCVLCTVRIYVAKAPKLHVYREERWFLQRNGVVALRWNGIAAVFRRAGACSRRFQSEICVSKSSTSVHFSLFSIMIQRRVNSEERKEKNCGCFACGKAAIYRETAAGAPHQSRFARQLLACGLGQARL